MAAKRFKQVVEGERPEVHHAPSRHMAAPARDAGGIRPQAAPQHQPRPHAATQHQPRFAEASRATAGAHHFSQLGGNDSFNLAEGQVPVTSVASDDGVGVSFANDDAPRPIGVDPAVTGSFHTITPGQGAVLSTRETAAHAAEVAREAMPEDDVAHRTPKGDAMAGVVTGRRAARRKIRGRKRGVAKKAPEGAIVGIVVAGLAVIVLMLVLAAALMGPADDVAAGGDAAATQPLTQVDPGQRLEMNGASFGVSQTDAGWAFVRESAGESSTVFTLAGVPVTVLTYNGAFYIPENLGDGTWDVMSYMLADGAVPGQVSGSDGQPVTGQGEVSSAEVNDGNLVIWDVNGNVTTVRLA